MDLRTFVELARKFSDLGDAITDQMVSVVNGEALEDQNSNALLTLQEFFFSETPTEFEGEEILEKLNDYLDDEPK